jgi:hypothetical protein
MKIRSLTLGDCAHYKSPYMRGVAQAMKLLGHDHAEVSIRLPARTIEQRIRMWKPTLIWTHMLMWPPPGSPPVDRLIEIVTGAAKRGARVMIHDGDARAATRFPRDISAWCSLALVNHEYDRSAWNVPTLHWPYFASVQKDFARPVEELRCELFFAGTLGPGIYAKRTALVEAVKSRGVRVRLPVAGDNTIDRTPEIAASADAVLGFGRPEIPGWVDTRVWQYPGAGGILVHDDVRGYLEPWVHFVPYASGDADSVVEALARLRAMKPNERMSIRLRAHAHVQEHHSSVARVKQVLRRLEAA